MTKKKTKNHALTDYLTLICKEGPDANNFTKSFAHILN